MFSHIILTVLLVNIAMFCITVVSCLIYVAAIGGKYPNPDRTRFMEIGRWVIDVSQQVMYVLFIVLVIARLFGY